MNDKDIENFYIGKGQLHTNNPSNKQTNSDIKTMQHRDREIVTRDSILDTWKKF